MFDVRFVWSLQQTQSIKWMVNNPISLSTLLLINKETVEHTDLRRVNIV